MTYSITKPDAGPSPRIDVVQIKTNFSQYAAIFSKTVLGVKYNHTPLNDKNQGNHESVILTRQTVDPGVTQTLDVLYCKDATSNINTQPQLFVQIPKFLPTKDDTTNALNAPMQLTYNTVNVVGPNQYQSFLAGGYLFFFGSTNDITIPITLVPAPTQILVAIATPNKKTTLGTGIPFSVSTTILSNDSFQINSTLNGTGPVIGYTFGWTAIARA